MNTDTQKQGGGAVASSDGLGAFKPRGAGAKWELPGARSVEAHPGENGEIYLVWTNGEHQTVARLSNEAAKITAVALLRYVGTERDMNTHQSA